MSLGIFGSSYYIVSPVSSSKGWNFGKSHKDRKCFSTSVECLTVVESKEAIFSSYIGATFPVFILTAVIKAKNINSTSIDTLTFKDKIVVLLKSLVFIIQYRINVL